MESEREPAIVYPRPATNHCGEEDGANLTGWTPVQDGESSRQLVLRGETVSCRVTNRVYEQFPNEKKAFSRSKISAIFMVVVIVLIAVMAICLTLHLRSSNNKDRTKANETESNERQILALKLNAEAFEPTKPAIVNEKEPRENLINVVGDDKRMAIFAGEELNPWKVDAKHGSCSLESKSRIVVNRKGCYKVSGKVTFENEATPLVIKVPGRLESFVEPDPACKKRCITVFEKNTYLLKGDRISITSNKRATVLMTRNSSYLRLKQVNDPLQCFH